MAKHTRSETESHKRGQWHRGEVCLACSTTDHDYCRGGMCTMCVYETNLNLTDVKGVNPRSYRMRCDHKTRECTVRCMKCNLWLPINRFSFNPKSGMIGRHCSGCLGKAQRDKRAGSPGANRRNAYERERRRKLYQEDLKADAAFAAWKDQCDKGTYALVSLAPIWPILLQWLDILVQRHGTLIAVSHASGVEVRRITSLHQRAQEKVSVDILERLCEAADGNLELVVPTGRDGWGAHGERHCEDCGTFFHPYHAAGRCRRCYNNYQRRGHVPQEDYWSPRHRIYRCRHCQLNKSDGRVHVGRGLCKICWNRDNKARKEEIDEAS